MKHHISKGFVVFVMAMALGSLVGLAGCMGSVSGLNVSVPGKDTVEQAIAALEAQAENIKPIQLYGNCKLGYVDEDGKRREHNVSYKLWLDPPNNIVLQGSVVIGNRGLIQMGSNSEEFWFAIQPEINTYWWGRWADVQDSLPLPLSPQIFLEALGRVTFDRTSNWILNHEPGIDILTDTDPSGKRIKQLNVFTSDYRLRKIRYFDDNGEVAVVVDLGFYEHHGGVLLPSVIQVASYTDGKVMDSIKLHVERGQETTYRQNQFQRRKPRGYDKVWQYTVDGFIEAK